MISHPHRCIFVHIPKTAGNSINRVFGVGWENHKDLQRYFAEHPRETVESYFKFAIVRNPWDRLLSDYNYQKKKSREQASKLFVFSERGRERGFAEWIDAALASPDFYEPSRWGGEVSPHIHRWSPQVDWITVDSVPRVDFVAHLENLPHDFRLICERLGLPPVRLPHRNRRLHWHYSHYYDRTTRDIVAAYYARDIEQFGYEFEHARLRLAIHWPFASQSRLAAPPPALPASADITPESTAVGEVSVAPPPVRRAPPAWRRHASTLATSLSLLVCAFIFTGFGSAPDSAARELVRTVMHRTYAQMVPARPAPSSDPFFNLIQRATRMDLCLVPLATGAFTVIPLTTPAQPPQVPIAYGLLPGPIPPTDADQMPPPPRWHPRRS